eukprot:3574475-Prorocentrum_lima.AAC.1
MLFSMLSSCVPPMELTSTMCLIPAFLAASNCFFCPILRYAGGSKWSIARELQTRANPGEPHQSTSSGGPVDHENFIMPGFLKRRVFLMRKDSKLRICRSRGRRLVRHGAASALGAAQLQDVGEEARVPAAWAQRRWPPP